MGGAIIRDDPAFQTAIQQIVAASFSFRKRRSFSARLAPHLKSFLFPAIRIITRQDQDLHVRVVWAITRKKRKKEVRKRPANIFLPSCVYVSPLLFSSTFCFPFARSSGTKKKKERKRTERDLCLRGTQGKKGKSV